MITLANYENLDDIIKEVEKNEANSLTDLIYRKKLKESFEDKGISGFKEINNINNISFGHFILLEKMLDLDIGEKERLKMIMPIILRPESEDSLDNEDRENENLHRDEIFKIPIGSIYGALNKFLELRHEYLYKTYNGVIYAALDEGEEDEEEESEGTQTDSSQSARQFHTKKFFWQSLISTIAQGDIFKFDKVVELKMYVVMPYLAEKRSLEIVENLEYKASRI